MKNKFRTLSFLFIALMIASCSGSKSYYKKGKKLEENGLSEEAAQFYLEAVKRKKTNADAIIALKKTGQKVLDKKYADFYKLYSAELHREAVYAYLDAEKFRKNVASVNIDLNAAPYYKSYYEEVRDAYIVEQYAVAQKHLDEENFGEAEKTLNEIKTLDPSYKNVKELSSFAFVEPKYREALNAYDEMRFRQAYFLFHEINERVKDGYKESREYEMLSLESAQYVVALLPINAQNHASRQLAQGVSASVLNAMKALDDPFLKIVDKSTQQAVTDEQFNNLSMDTEKSVFVKSAQNLGSDALLISKLINTKVTEGKLRKSSKTGWLGKELRYVDPVTKEKKIRYTYSKVYYYQYQQQNEVELTYQFQLISTKTGEVLLSGMRTFKEQDEINYATFNGDARLLFAGYWTNQYKKSQSDRRYDSPSQKRQLDNLLRSRKEIAALSSLKTEIYNDVGTFVGRQLKAFNPEN